MAVNLAHVFGSDIQLLDCDVEEPNAHLFLRGDPCETETVTIPVPQVDESLCDACGLCAEFCQYNAIASLGAKPLIFAEMCHGCGGCMKVCPKNAITEAGKRMGVVETISAGAVTLIQGRLDVGSAMAPPAIRAVKARLRRGLHAIVDAPPGTSCPVITAIQNTDFIVLVTEPTPFGLHDLKLAIDMVRELQIPYGVVVNRMGVGDDRVHVYCRQEGMPVLLEIPDDRRIAEAYSRGDIITEVLPEYQGLFKNLLRKAFDAACQNQRSEV